MADYKKLKSMLNPYQNDESLVETAGKAVLPYVQPALDSAAPYIEKAQPVLNVLDKPRQWMVEGVDKVTGGTGDAQSFVDVASRLNKELPEEYQNLGLAKDVGYAADFLTPSPTKGFGKVLGIMNKDAKIVKNAAQLYKEAKDSGKGVALLSDETRRLIPNAETAEELGRNNIVANQMIGTVRQPISALDTPSTLREIEGLSKPELQSKIGTVASSAKELAPASKPVTMKDISDYYHANFADQLEAARGKVPDDIFNKMRAARLQAAKDILIEKARSGK